MAKEFKSFYKQVSGNEGSKCHYATRLDTYGTGCQHNCQYCYAKSLLDFRGLWHPEDPAVADIDKVIRKVKRLPKMPAIRLGGMTDCFQPLEAKEHATYQTIRALQRKKQEYLIVTKSAMVASDLYIHLMNKNLAHIQMTITCFDDDLYKKLGYEKASPPSERIKAIEKLQEAGFDVQLRLSPLVPEFFDLDKISKIHCDKILVEFLRVNSWIKKWFDIDYSAYTVKESGYQHLPLEKKIGYINQLKPYFKELTVCEDETEAYEYWKKNVNPNPDDCCNLRRPA